MLQVITYLGIEGSYIFCIVTGTSYVATSMDQAFPVMPISDFGIIHANHIHFGLYNGFI